MQTAEERSLIPPSNLGKLHPDHKPVRLWLPRVVRKSYIGADTAIQTKRRAIACEIAQIKRARRQFGAFMEYCFINEDTGEPFNQQWFHNEWDDAMSTCRRLVIVAPRDHGKTSQIVGRVIFELGNNPNLRIKIVCAADGRAKERLFEVVQHLKYNKRVKRVFPNLRQAEAGEWSKHKIVGERTARHRDASVEAIGITSTATGGRADLLVADDVVDQRNALSFPALREQIKQAWKSDWTNLLEPDSTVWYICTLWHKDDLSHQLMENPVYKVMFYAIPEDFGAMWKDKWPSEALWRRYKEIGSVEFNRGFRNVAVDLETVIINPAWFKYKDLRNDPEFRARFKHLVFFTSLDTAGSPSPTAKKQNPGQAYTGEVVIAVDPQFGRIYVLSEWMKRVTTAQAAARVIQNARRYKPFRALIEKVSQAAVDEWVLNEEPSLLGIVEPVKPRVSKEQRLLGITPLMERGDVIFDKSLDPDNSSWGPGHGSLVHQLQDFPFGKFKDLVDAFSQALHAARGYFLDWGANEGENKVDVTIGQNGNGNGGLDKRFFF
jgi:phage terminase large subunit-like protein